jgi:hypothetical protein
MPWKTSRPAGSGVQAKYRTKEHRDTCAAYKAQLERDGYLICAQPTCLHRTRTILPGMRWAAGHDDTGTHYIGPVHQKCNAVDGAKRARARQTASRLRW